MRVPSGKLSTGVYQWHVHAANSQGYGPESGSWSFTVEAGGSLSWGDEFSYGSVGDLSGGGWVVTNPQYVSVDGSSVTLDNDGSVNGQIKHSLPIAVSSSSWRVEFRSMWVGRSCGSLYVTVYTGYHSYTWGGDGYYSEYVLVRDGVKVIRNPGYTPQLNVWMTFAIERSGNRFSLYHEGNLIATYDETETRSDYVMSIYFDAGWLSTDRFDYVHVTSGGVAALTAVNLDMLTVTQSVSMFSPSPSDHMRTAHQSRST